MAQDESRMDGKPRGTRRMTVLADLIGDTLKPAAKKRGFASIDLFRNWADIVGPAYAERTRPERLSWPKRLEDGGMEGHEPATLVVACEGSRALLLQHEAPRLVDRINAVYGYEAIGRIRIIQKPVEQMVRPQSPRPRALSAGQEQRLGAVLAEVDDPGLRNALERLGRGVMGTPQPKAPGRA